MESRSSSNSSNVKRRRLEMPQSVQKRHPIMLYGIDVNDHEWTNYIEECPAYQPSRKDFEDPLAYLQKISPRASNYGICKIVSPLSDFVPTSVVVKKELNELKFKPNVQPLKYGTWLTMEDKISYKRGRGYDYKEFERMANLVFSEKYSSAACLPCNLMEREFWQEMAWGENETVQYGVNIEASAADGDLRDELGQSKWNLKYFSHLPESTLRFYSKGNSRHNDSNVVYWNGVQYFCLARRRPLFIQYKLSSLGCTENLVRSSRIRARNFEQVAYDHVYSEEVLPCYDSDGAAQILAEKTTMLPPSLFLTNNVPVYKVVQMPGEFVITFPRSYHAGFSHGFNCAEAVNFAVGDWFPFGSIASKRYSFIEQNHPINPYEELLCKEALHLHAIIPFEELLCKEALHLCHQMKSSTSSQNYSSSHNAIMVSCISHMIYHRAARRKLDKRNCFLHPRRNTFGTVYCDFCHRDRCLAFLMCHQCQIDPSRVYHETTLVNCHKCGAERSLFLSDDLRAMEAAADYFETFQNLLSSYLTDTAPLQEEIQELYEREIEDGEGETSMSVKPEE